MVTLYTTASGGLTTNPAKAVSTPSSTTTKSTTTTSTSSSSGGYSEAEIVAAEKQGASLYNPLSGQGGYVSKTGDVIKVSGGGLVGYSSTSGEGYVASATPTTFTKVGTTQPTIALTQPTAGYSPMGDAPSSGFVPVYTPTISRSTAGTYQTGARSITGTITPDEPTGLLGRSKRFIAEEQYRVDTGKAGGLEKTSVIIASGVLGVGEGIYKGVKAVFTPKETIKGFYETGKLVVQDVGSVIKGEGSTILSGFGETIKTSPSRAAEQVGEIYGFGKGFGKTLEVGSKTTGRILTVVDPRFKPVVEGKIQLGETEIEVAGGVESTAEPLSKQVEIAGTEVTAVTAQRGLFSPLKKEVIIDKPNPQGIPLEQSLFADPRGRLRTSRLGLEAQPEATIIDILSGDFTFKKTAQPQAIFFEKAPVEALPKDIVETLKSGKSLSASQEARLLQQQLTPTGKFKPIGFLSKESEITLAPTEIIKAKKTEAVTIIGGKRVPIIRGEVVQASPRTFELLEKQRSGDISKTEFKELIKRFKEETGSDISSTPVKQTPLLRPSRFLRFRPSSPSVIIPSTSRTPSGIVNSPPSSPPSSPPRSPQIVSPPSIPSSPSSPTYPSSPRTPTTPLGSSPSTGRVNPLNNILRVSIIPSKITSRTPIKDSKIIPSDSKIKDFKEKGYNVYVKSTEKKPVFIKVNNQPLTKQQALERGSYVTDNTKAATFQIREATGKPKPSTQITSYFDRTKFREYQKVRGEKRLLKDTYIEKRANRIDTPGELNDITVKGLLAQERSRGRLRF